MDYQLYYWTGIQGRGEFGNLDADAVAGGGGGPESPRRRHPPGARASPPRRAH